MKLQYISQGKTLEDHLSNIRKVCEGGGKWIQLRLKNVEEEKYINIAEKAKIICDEFDSKLIINDNVSIALKVDADGVHLGKNDMPPAKAREILGPQKVIGATANTLNDCIELHNQTVDYIGLGPYRFTTTKENLSPVLGLAGYSYILQELKRKNYNLPVIAIGGILEKDISPIIKTGVSGVAVSGMLTGSENINEIIERVYKLTYSYDLDKIKI